LIWMKNGTIWRLRTAAAAHAIQQNRAALTRRAARPRNGATA
jgi:hypothetical protein